jgi:hypothetical protein
MRPFSFVTPTCRPDRAVKFVGREPEKLLKLKSIRVRDVRLHKQSGNEPQML